MITFKDDGTFTFSPDPNKTGGAGTWNVTADTPEAGFDGVFVFKVTNTTTSTTCSYKANETTMTFGGCSLQNLTFTRKT